MDKQARTPERAMEKWGDAAIAGFQVLPDILLKKQVELGLSATDMLVLLNLTLHWWYREQRPFPRTSTIAARMGVEPRTVQRSLRKMVDMGLLERVEEEDEAGEKRQVIDLTALVEKLSAFARHDEHFQYRKQKAAAA